MTEQKDFVEPIKIDEVCPSKIEGPLNKLVTLTEEACKDIDLKPGKVVTISVDNQKPLTAHFTEMYGIEQDKVIAVLKDTIFKGGATNSQLMMFMTVCKQYNLNPFIKEIYAYPDRAGVVPIVSVDGWNTLIQRRSDFDYYEFKYSEAMVEANSHGTHKAAHEWVECHMYRKGSDKPFVVREYFDEVFVENKKFSGPWQTHTKRMHRHKAMIQGARTAFGFSGIYDEDEGKRIIDVTDNEQNSVDLTDDIIEAATEGDTDE